MNFKNLNLGTQLKIGVAIMLFFVVILGVVSYQQTARMHLLTEKMYNHPVKVRKTIGNLEKDILSLRLGMRDLMLASTEQDKQQAMRLMELSETDALLQFKVLKENYLGPKSDIEEAHKAFVSWRNTRHQKDRLSPDSELSQLKDKRIPIVTIGVERDRLLEKIKTIDLFAENKAKSLYDDANEIHKSLVINLIFLVAVILLFSLIVNFVIIGNIRIPIDILINMANQFHGGDMNARSSYKMKNEFGVLSDSFNALAEYIQFNTEVAEKARRISSVMLSEYDAKKFFQATLNALVKISDCQMAAVYLLNNDKKNFEHFESVGLNENARQSFAADKFEGEFGVVLSSRKVQHIKNIPHDTKFVFQTVSGKFIPREIITIPILSGNKVVAVISLANINIFSNQSVQLIDNSIDTLNARIEGVLVYRKMKEFSEKLKIQNNELEAQKTELFSQSAELTIQNTELEMQKVQLNEASRLKTNFLSNMSHELRTPLNSVIALSGVLNRRLAKVIPNEEYSYIEVIERNGKHLLHLINDILDISRIESGRVEVEITKFNANNLIAEVVSMIYPQAQQKGIELLHTGSNSDLFLSSDAAKCHHILQNIISNAVKFTEKGKVEVTAQQIDHHIVITVSDTGIGIAENHIEHIFDEFRQADGSTSRKFGGTGLGLAIAKKYTHLLGGSIVVKSEPEKGSEFILRLPLHYAADNRNVEVGETSVSNYSIKSALHVPINASMDKTILLVDDSGPAIIQMKDFLLDSGCKVLVANDGAEALAVIDHFIPDAIILDLMMPGIDGFNLLKTLREIEKTAHIPVLILTAKHITKEDLRFLTRNNVHQLIQKGDVNRNELLHAITTMISPLKVIKSIQPELQNIIGKPVILVVEDNPDNMITVKALLADQYIVLEAVDGKQGVNLTMQNKVHLILMDIALPGMDGIETFKAIRENEQFKHIPVIALTASAMINDRETILAYGFDDYIAKPIDEKTFYRKINETLYGK